MTEREAWIHLVNAGAAGLSSKHGKLKSRHRQAARRIQAHRARHDGKVIES